MTLYGDGIWQRKAFERLVLVIVSIDTSIASRSEMVTVPRFYQWTQLSLQLQTRTWGWRGGSRGGWGWTGTLPWTRCIRSFRQIQICNRTKSRRWWPQWTMGEYWGIILTKTYVTYVMMTCPIFLLHLSINSSLRFPICFLKLTPWLFSH